jgi:hypothetical protein
VLRVFVYVIAGHLIAAFLWLLVLHRRALEQVIRHGGLARLVTAPAC